MRGKKTEASSIKGSQGERKAQEGERNSLVVRTAKFSTGLATLSPVVIISVEWR